MCSKVGRASPEFLRKGTAAHPLYSLCTGRAFARNSLAWPTEMATWTRHLRFTSEDHLASVSDLVW